MSESPIPEPEWSEGRSVRAGSETDLGELAALFAQQSGGSLSAEVAADLALDIVLSEIAEQACMATGATGAAIILGRDGEMVCRASSGVNAPETGARFGGDVGLTAECIRTQQVQRCSDALTDPRADFEASRNLGVRSVLVLPLTAEGRLVGLIEVFSSRAGAFAERDELTLDALAQRILKNIERARQTLSAPVAASGMEAPFTKANDAEIFEMEAATASFHEEEHKEDEEAELNTNSFEQAAPARMNVMTLTLGAAVVVCALLLAALVGVRLSSPKKAGGRETNRASEAASTEQKTAVPDGSGQVGGGPASGALPASSTGEKVAKKKDDSHPAENAGASKRSLVPEGSLSVYENGKEVFHMAPSRVDDGRGDGVQRASAVEAEAPAKLTPEASGGNLLHRVEPEYPEAARQKGIQGAVVLDLRIGRDGAVQSVNLVSGEPVLADAAIATAKRWRFKPRADAEEMQTRVTLNFRLP